MANSLLILLTRDKFRVLVLVACAAFFLHGQEYEAVQDDAFISFVYSKHLAAGEGLVFNLGERVEGYTNFLWVALMALPHLFSVDVIFCARWLNLLASFATLFVVSSLSAQIAHARPMLLGLFSPILLACNGALAFWTFSGMETALFTWLVTLGAYLYIREIYPDPEQADEIYPNPAFVEHYRSGLHALKRDEDAAALDHFVQCIRTGTNDFSYPHLSIGQLHFKNKQVAAAIPHLQKAVGLDPHNAHAHAYLSLSYLFDNSAPETAIDLAETAMALSPQSHLVRFVYGLALLQSRRLPEAIDNLQKAISLVGGQTERAYFYLGQAYYQQGQLAQAKAMWQRVLTYNPQRANCSICCSTIR